MIAFIIQIVLILADAGFLVLAHNSNNPILFLIFAAATVLLTILTSCYYTRWVDDDKASRLILSIPFIVIACTIFFGSKIVVDKNLLANETDAIGVFIAGGGIFLTGIAYLVETTIAYFKK